MSEVEGTLRGEEMEDLRRENAALKKELASLKQTLRGSLFEALHGEARNNHLGRGKNLLFKTVVPAAPPVQFQAASASAASSPSPPVPPRADRVRSLVRKNSLMKRFGDGLPFEQDSPMWRASLRGYEKKSSASLKAIDAILFKFKEYTQNGRRFASVSTAMASLMRHGLIFEKADKENILVQAMVQFGEIVDEIANSLMVLLSSLENAFVFQHKAFVADMKAKSSMLKKKYVTAGNELEAHLHKVLLGKRRDSQTPEELEKDVSAARRNFEVSRFMLCKHLNKQREHELVESSLAAWYSYKAYFNQCRDIFIALEPKMKDMSARITKEHKDIALHDAFWDQKEQKLRKLLSTEGLENVFALSKTDAVNFPSGAREKEAIMMGWLYKQSSNLLKDWKRRFFILQGGKLYYVTNHSHGSLDDPVLVCDVMLCTVRSVTGSRLAFEIISPTSRTYLLQAESKKSLDKWVRAIQHCTETMLVGNGIGNGQMAHKSGSSARGPTSCSETMQAVLQSNPFCCDCSNPNPDWASINLGSLICIECSGIHRSLGVHVSKVRSVGLDHFSPVLGDMMNELGNDIVNKVYEAEMHKMSGWQRPNGDNSGLVDRTKFIKAKYVYRGFLSQEGLGKGEGFLLPAICKAVYEADIALVFKLIAYHDANLNGLCVENEFLEGGGSDNFSPLHVACKHGRLTIAELLFLNGASLMTVDINGCKPVDLAMLSNKVEMIEWCLDKMSNAL
jgi:Arf-GAP with coiled-coil, ANK repeat and PH domain-containing protein